jgi:hypothetical protein
VKALGDAAEADAPRHQVVDDGQDVLGIAPEADELPDHHGV